MLALRQKFEEIKMGRAFLGIVKDPNRTEKIFELSEIGMHSADQRGVKALVEYVLSVSDFENLYTDRYLPKLPDLESLGGLPEGTLGREFLHHMTVNHLALDFFPEIKVVSPMAYLSTRIRQTHDIWHVVCGYDTSVKGELGLQAFMLGQIPSALSASLLSGGLLHYIKNHPNELQPFMDCIVEGYSRGKSAKFLLSQKWEERWHVPLVEIRNDLSL